MVGNAGATMVWSSAASSIDSSTPPMMAFFSLSLIDGEVVVAIVVRLSTVWSMRPSFKKAGFQRLVCGPQEAAGSGRLPPVVRVSASEARLRRTRCMSSDIGRLRPPLASFSNLAPWFGREWPSLAPLQRSRRWQLAALDALHPVAQEPDDPAFEVDAFDAIELHLGAVVLGEDGGRDFGGLRLRGCAGLLRINRLQRVLEFAGMVLGDLGMTLLVALDVRRQCVPEEPDVRIGLARTPPLREDHLDGHGDLRVRDPAGIRRLRVADAGGESHLRGARMPGARALHLGSVFRQLFFDVVQSAAGDAEIAVG